MVRQPVGFVKFDTLRVQQNRHKFAGEVRCGEKIIIGKDHRNVTPGFNMQCDPLKTAQQKGRFYFNRRLGRDIEMGAGSPISEDQRAY